MGQVRGRLLYIAFLLAVVGCAQGPRDLSRTRAPYNEAVQRTGAEQMLLNLVRLKYRESPEFLAITAIASQSTYDGGGSVGVGIPEAALSALNLGASAGFSERPTITYNARDDAEFQRGLLEPVPLATIALVTQTGWASDRVQRLAIKNINGVDNATSAGGPTPDRKPDFERFQRAAYLLRSLQHRRWVELAPKHREIILASRIPIQQVTSEEIVLAKAAGYSMREMPNDPGWAEFYQQVDDLALWFHQQAWTTPEAQELAYLLEIQPGQECYLIKSSSLEQGQLAMTWSRPNEARGELLMTSRSVLEMMYYLSQAVPAPPEHINRGLITITRDPAGNVFDWNQLTAELFRVQICDECPAPGVAFVAVPYRGFWFYIADNDLTSKATFSLLQEIYNIEVRGGDQGIPFIIGS